MKVIIIDDIDRLISVIDLQVKFGIDKANEMFVKLSKPMATTSIPSTSTTYLRGSYVTISYTRMVHVKLSEVYLLAEDRLGHIDDRVNVELWQQIKEFAKNDFQESYNALRRFNERNT